MKLPSHNAYDPIGNRTSASETIGGEILAKAYTANALNQYTAIANPDAVGLRGDATNTAVVTVNGQAVQSDNIASDTVPWHFALEADNASGSDFPFAEIMAVVNPPGTNTPDIVSTSSGHLYAPPQTETLTYDLDGNLTSDGRWHYTWNGENRLIKVEELLSPTNRQPYTVKYAYDHRGRMVWKQISTNAVVVSTRTLHWDGYNIIAETLAQDTATNLTYNIWGLDLSGSLQGAGGVGGLLAVVRDDETSFLTYDANGNVTEYLSADGTIVAHYEYSPFGEIIVQSGDLAASFTHRFSTKPWCAVTGLCEYQYRKYSPLLGRWLSRDPIGEFGGRNLYGFAFNAATFRVDTDGRFVFPVMIIPPDTVPTTWTCSSAKARCQKKIDEWKNKGYDLAIDLLKHYLDNSGKDYSLSDENVEELKEHAGDKICSKVSDAVCGKTGSHRSISIAPEDEDDSNVRWWYIGSDKNMLFAYGGARLTVVGEATMDNANWSGTFNVTLTDKYEWDKVEGLLDEFKEALSALWSDAYSAALYLQKNCGYSHFSHSTDFDLPCSGCCD